MFGSGPCLGAPVTSGTCPNYLGQIDYWRASASDWTAFNYRVMETHRMLHWIHSRVDWVTETSRLVVPSTTAATQWPIEPI